MGNSAKIENTKLSHANIDEVEERSDSSNDEEKFLKAAQANASARLSEK